MSKQYQISEKSRRILAVIYKAIAGLIATGISLWFAWNELGVKIFSNQTFIVVLAMWFILGFTFFINEFDKATQKTTSDKLDELIEEMKGLREDVKRINKQ
jgi:hypothetical protein